MPCLKDDKKKVQRFIDGFPLAFKDQIEYDEPQSFEEVIGKLKHCYQNSKHKSRPKQDWKGNEKAKGKWAKKRSRPQDTGDKENVGFYKKSNVADIRHGFQHEEQDKDDGRKPMQCWICGGEHRRRYCPSH